jgi:hypothetical protein
MESETKTLSSSMQKFIPLAMLLYISTILYIIANDENALDKKYYQYSILLIFPIITFSFFATNMFVDITTPIKQYILVCVSFFAMVAVYAYYVQTNRTITKTVNRFMFIVFFLIVVVFLAMVYIVFIQYIKNSTGWFSIIMEFIFIIPCYFIDIIKYLQTEMKSTHPLILILFFIEIVAILLYFYIPKMYNYIINRDKSVILKSPVFLASPTVVLEHGENDAMDKEYNRILKYEDGKYHDVNYTISFWLYLNVDNGGTQEKNIMMYGNDKKNEGKPRVVYKNTKENVDEMVVYLANSGSSPKFDFSLPSQKWNHVVITYNQKVCELWVNGNLEQIVRLGEVVAGAQTALQYSNDDKIIVGDVNGKHGYIKRLKYTHIPMDKNKIVADYNLGI